MLFSNQNSMWDFSDGLRERCGSNKHEYPLFAVYTIMIIGGYIATILLLLLLSSRSRYLTGLI